MREIIQPLQQKQVVGEVVSAAHIWLLFFDAGHYYDGAEGELSAVGISAAS